MAWRGKTRVGARFGGRHGGLVELGDVAVPRVAVYAHDGDEGEPDLEVTFEVRDGRPECVDFHVRAKAGGRGIRTVDLQMVTNLDAMVEYLYERVTPVPGGSAFNWMWRQTEENAERARRAAYEARKARRGTVTRAMLEDVAKVYREHLDSSPTRAVAIEFGLAPRTAARRVEQARAVGLLPQTTPGKRKA
jgi:hypothetical protein